MQLDNKNVVVTGGAGGLGLSMAKALGEKGATPVLIDINPDALDRASAELSGLGIQAKTYVADITDEAKVEALFDQIVADLGTVDGLVNNAGITRDGLLVKSKDGELKKMSLQDWDQCISTNLTGTFLCGREAAAKMIELSIEGVIINISSISRSGNFGQTNYSAAKAGVAAMAITWAKELARYNIRSAAIAPGFMKTEMTASMPQNTLDAIADSIPKKRLGDPNEIAQAVTSIFENDYFTGRILEVDGGLRI